MSVKKAKQKAALIVVAAVVAFFVIPALYVILHNFIYAAVAILSFVGCIALTIWGIYDEVWRKIYARDKMIEDLYARCNSDKQRWFTKFYIEYFKL